MRKHRQKTKPVVGFAWYRPEQWQLLREVSSDPENLEQTHAEWLALAEKTLGDIQRAGVPAVKVDVDVEELLKWSRDEGRKVDGGARAGFAQWKMRQAKVD